MFIIDYRRGSCHDCVAYFLLLDVVFDSILVYSTSFGNNIKFVTTQHAQYTLTINNTVSSHAFTRHDGGGLFINTDYTAEIGTCTRLAKMPSSLSKCVILNSKFTDNSASQDGGGIMIENSLRVTIKSTEISSNNGAQGSGLYLTRTPCSSQEM